MLEPLQPPPCLRLCPGLWPLVKQLFTCVSGSEWNRARGGACNASHDEQTGDLVQPTGQQVADALNRASVLYNLDCSWSHVCYLRQEKQRISVLSPLWQRRYSKKFQSVKKTHLKICRSSFQPRRYYSYIRGWNNRHSNCSRSWNRSCWKKSSKVMR